MVIKHLAQCLLFLFLMFFSIVSILWSHNSWVLWRNYCLFISPPLYPQEKLLLSLLTIGKGRCCLFCLISVPGFIASVMTLRTNWCFQSAEVEKLRFCFQAVLESYTGWVTCVAWDKLLNLSFSFNSCKMAIFPSWVFLRGLNGLKTCKNIWHCT